MRPTMAAERIEEVAPKEQALAKKRLCRISFCVMARVSAARLRRSSRAASTFRYRLFPLAAAL
jgi:hypothetical protein